MTTSATHGARNSIGSTVQPGTHASDDSRELLSQAIGGTTGFNLLANGKGILKLLRAEFAQPEKNGIKLKERKQQVRQSGKRTLQEALDHQ